MYNIYSDGGARGNPGPAAIGFVVYEKDKEIHKDKKFIGEQTNNYAEYFAVIDAMNYCINNNLHTCEIKFFLDSQLVVKQLNKEYKIKDENLKKMAKTIFTLLNKFTYVSFTHIPRADNKAADKLVNEALDQIF